MLLSSLPFVTIKGQVTCFADLGRSPERPESCPGGRSAVVGAEEAALGAEPRTRLPLHPLRCMFCLVELRFQPIWI